jgi:hypothetical protein
MSGSIINQTSLDRYTRDPNLEIRKDNTNNTVSEKTGSLGGRLVRELSVIFGSGPSKTEKTSIMEAKQQTLKELQAVFGDKIGLKAFRAHIGESDGRGGWITSAANPITGRHIIAMVETAKKEFAREYDDSRMRQISIGGMAGPFSKGVCKAATMEWFRRIDNGKPTWRHEDGGQLDRKGIDWEAKRARLQKIQDDGQGQDPRGLFDQRIYVTGQPFYLEQIEGGRVDLDKGNELAHSLFDSARQRFDDEDDPNQFWQLNVNLSGRIGGRVDHAIGIHVTRVPGQDTGTERDFVVHVFDSNRREAIDIPGEKFGIWLSSHMTRSYDDRVNSMMLMDVTKQAPSKKETDQEIPDDFSMDDSKSLPSDDDDFVTV